MLSNHKLVLDTFCEVYDLIKHWADAEFWNFEEHIASGRFFPGAVYLIGRRQFVLNSARIRELVETDQIRVILSNPAEGSDTMRMHCTNIFHIDDLVKSGKILVIGGGDMDPAWPCLQYDSFLPKILDYEENKLAVAGSDEVYNKLNKPYKFLFLNGRTRPHRKYLLEKFRLSGLLDQSLWTWLDTTTGRSRSIQLIDHGSDLLDKPNHVKYLPIEYEFNFYQDRIAQATNDSFVKHHLFNNEWGEIYLKSEPYVDTYFSLVTETVFEYPYSFRTEKIWKPIAMGHPWIAVANQGYYRDMHNLGFQTFSHVIDESFDSIQNSQDRIERIAQIVEDLCQQDLASFLNECYNVCKYNQQHLAEMSQTVRNEFPQRFNQFINEHINA
jgi:hypothetical protein